MTVSLQDVSGKIYDFADQDKADVAVKASRNALKPIKSLQSVAPAVPEIPEDSSSQSTDLSFQTKQPDLPDQNQEVVERAEQNEARQIQEQNDLKNAPIDPGARLVSKQRVENAPVPIVPSAKEDCPDLPLLDAEGKAYDFPNLESAQKAISSSKGALRFSTQQERHHLELVEDEKRKLDKLDPVARFTSVSFTNAPYIGEIINALPLPDDNGDDSGISYMPTGSTPERLEIDRQLTRKSDPITSLLGKYVGGFNELLIGGEVAEGLEISAGVAEGGGLGGALARSAIQTGVFAAPDVARSLANDDPDKAAEALALSAVGVVGGHLLFGGLGKLFNVGAEAFGKASAEAAERESAKSVEQLYLEKAGVDIAKDDLKEAAAKLEKYAQSNLDSAAEKAFTKLDTAETSLPIIRSALDKTAIEVEKLLPDALTYKLGQRAIAEEALSKAIETLKSVKTPAESAPALEAYTAAQEELSKLPKLSKTEITSQKILETIKQIMNETDGTFSSAEQAKKQLAKMPQTSLVKKAMAVLDSNLSEAKQAAALKLGDSEVNIALREQANTKNILDRIKEAQQEKPGLKLSDFMPSGGSLFHTAFHPISGATHMIGSVVKKAGMRLLRNSNLSDVILQASAPYGQAAFKTASNFFKTIDKPAVNGGLSESGLSILLPKEERSGRSTKRQFQTLSDQINSNLNNPDKFADTMAPVIKPLQEAGLSKVARSYSQHQLRLMKVIQTFMPKVSDVIDKSHPFAETIVGQEEIDPAVKDRFDRVVSIASDPTTLLELVKSNTITQGDVAIAAATNPILLSKMRQALTQAAIDKKPDMSYQQRLSVGILMGQNLDQSTEQVGLLQSSYPFQSPASSPPNRKPSKMSSGAADNISDASLTTSQKAAGH